MRENAAMFELGLMGFGGPTLRILCRVSLYAFLGFSAQTTIDAFQGESICPIPTVEKLFLHLGQVTKATEIIIAIMEMKNINAKIPNSGSDLVIL